MLSSCPRLRVSYGDAVALAFVYGVPTAQILALPNMETGRRFLKRVQETHPELDTKDVNIQFFAPERMAALHADPTITFLPYELAPDNELAAAPSGTVRPHEDGGSGSGRKIKLTKKWYAICLR